MRMDRRAGLLNASFYVPTLAELFADVSTYSQRNRSNATGSTFTISKPSGAAAGDTWYYLLCAGSSLEITRVDFLTSSSIRATRLSSTYASGQTQVTSSPSGSSMVTDINALSCLCAQLKFGTFKPKVVDYALSQCFKTQFAYRYASSASDYEPNLRVSKSTVTNKSGIALAAFVCYKDTSSRPAVFSVSECAQPTTPIICYSDSTRLTDRTGVRDSGTYLLPSLDGTTTANCYSYSYLRLYEDW